MFDLNLALILTKLKQQPEAVCGTVRHELTLQDVRMLQPGKQGEYSADFLYLTTWEALRKEAAIPPVLVCVGGGAATSKLCRGAGSDALIFGEGTDLISLLTELQEIFSEYHELHNTFRSLLIAQYPMFDILQACASFFENFLLLLDPNGNVLETATDYLPCADEAARQETAARLTEKLVASIFRFENQDGAGAPQIIRHVPAADGVPEYCVVSFYDGNRCIGMLAVCGGDRPLHPETETLLHYASNLLAPCVLGRYSPAVTRYSFLRSAITSIIDNMSVSTSAVSSTLAAIGWNEKDDYQLVYIRVGFGSSRNVMSRLSDYYRYESVFPDCVAVKARDFVVIVVHNASEEVLQSSIDSLRQLMISYRMDCCVSIPFGSFYSIREHYILTSSALEADDRQSKVLLYRDVMLKHVFREISGSLPVRALCHISAVRLHEYDQENGTNLLLALEKYLIHNRSLQDAATELFIHRNTMNYRLKCILRIVDLSLDSPRERLHLLLSCILLRQLDEQTHSG